MKMHKILIIYLFVFIIISFVIIIEINYMCFPNFENCLVELLPKIFKGHRDFFNNIMLGILGSSLVSMAIEIANYHIAKRESIVSFIYLALQMADLYERAVNSPDGAVEGSLENFRKIYDYSITEINNVFYNISFFIHNTKSENWINDSYFILMDTRDKIISKKQLLLDNNYTKKVEFFDELHKFMFRTLQIDGGIKTEYYHDIVKNDIRLLHNFMFKTVWYKSSILSDIIDKIEGKRYLNRVYKKLILIDANYIIIKWSQQIYDDQPNYYNMLEYSKYKRIPFTNYKVYHENKKSNN